MRKSVSFFAVAAVILVCLFSSCSEKPKQSGVSTVRTVMASDTILSGMLIALLPQGRYSVEAILPPGQCPGHYDVKLSDIEKLKKADLVVSFKGMPFMGKADLENKAHLIVDTGGRNWMAPDTYLSGLDILAEKLVGISPEDKDAIMSRRKEFAARIKAGADSINRRIDDAKIKGISVIASSMQKEPLEWMGLRVAAEYGRQESMSAKDVVGLIQIGKAENVKLIADNLQSGPDTGKSIAESLGVPHIVLANFPSENGYLDTLEKNVEAVIRAAAKN